MAIGMGNQIGWEILQLLGVKDSNIIEAHIHIKVDSIIMIDILRQATSENGDLVLTEDGKDIKTELKKYRLEEIEEK